jgi:hypothetical protein
MDKHVIIGVHVVDREAHAEGVQQVFTRFGSQIKTRLGLHDVHDGFSSSNGLIVLEMLDSPETSQMLDELKSMPGIDVESMVFEHL